MCVWISFQLIGLNLKKKEKKGTRDSRESPILQLVYNYVFKVVCNLLQLIQSKIQISLKKTDDCIMGNLMLNNENQRGNTSKICSV